MSLAWMPKDMPEAEKNAFAASTNDAHLAAALAWESWAAQIAAEPAVTSVSTGAQTITYAKGGSAFDAAMDRSNWHRSRSRVRSVMVGPKFNYGWDTQQERDQKTYDSAPMPITGYAQINLMNGTVGPKDLS